MSLALVVLACSGSTAPAAWPVREAFDVPPPPGAVSLDLGPVRTTTAYAPGDQVRLVRGGQTLTVELLDVQRHDGAVTLTVYAPAEIVEPWVLTAEPPTVRVVR
ncbi:MAG: hypothetical protein AAF602_08715 [Myxococcota bacterium]